MTSIHAPGRDLDPVRQRPGVLVEPAADPPTRREALGLLATLVAMLGVIFLLALTLGTSPLGQG